MNFSLYKKLQTHQLLYIDKSFAYSLCQSENAALEACYSYLFRFSPRLSVTIISMADTRKWNISDLIEFRWRKHILIVFVFVLYGLCMVFVLFSFLLFPLLVTCSVVKYMTSAVQNATPQRWIFHSPVTMFNGFCFSFGIHFQLKIYSIFVYISMHSMQPIFIDVGFSIENLLSFLLLYTFYMFPVIFSPVFPSSFDGSIQKRLFFFNPRIKKSMNGLQFFFPIYVLNVCSKLVEWII